MVVNMNRGGAETLIMNLYRNIDRTKVQFDFLTCKAGVFDSEIRQLGGNVYRIPYVTDVGHSGYIRALKQFLTANREYKIIHSHMDKMSGFVLQAAKKVNIPIRIAHSHNTESEGRLAQKAYKCFAGGYVTSSATHLYACSHAAANWLFGEKSKQAFILKNGIEADKFQYSQNIREKMRRELKINDDCFVLGHVGRFTQQKNHHFLLDIFVSLNKEVPNSILLLVGDGPLKPKIIERIEKLKLTDNVKLVGIREDIDQLLQAFDLFLFPSLHEGLPVTLIEAQGAGLPCVIADTITNEVDLGIHLVQHLPLADKAIWLKQIIHLANEKRSRTIKQEALALKGYDIRKTAKQTEASYLSLGAQVT